MATESIALGAAAPSERQPITATSIAPSGFGACWIAWITRAAAKNRISTISTGVTVHANSTWLLPYTWGGSRPSSSARRRNLTTA